MKYKPQDILVVYKGTPTFQFGALVQVIDYDPHDNSFLVAPLQDVYKYDGDIIKLMENSSKWIKQENAELVSFNRPSKVIYFFKQISSKLYEWMEKLKRKLSIRSGS